MTFYFDGLGTNLIERTEDVVKSNRMFRRIELDQEANQLQLASRKLSPEAFSRLEILDPKRPMPIELVEQYLPSLVVA